MSAAPPRTDGMPRDWAPLAIVACTFAAFFPVLGNGFVNWGDVQELVRNPHYRGLELENLVWMFTTILAGHYQPLTWLTFAVDYSIWGMRPLGYHLTSLVLHAASAVVTYHLIRRLLRLARSWPGGERHPAARLSALAGALFFALHPLRVESVAWASERRGVLSGLLFLLAVVAYLRYAEARGPGRKTPQPGISLGWALTAFALALLAKEFAVTLPAVLVVLDVYPLRRLPSSVRRWLAPPHRAVWREKVPFFALSSIGMVVAALSSAQSGVARSLVEHGPLERMAQAVYGPAFYLWKTLVPSGLSPLHPIPAGMNPWAPRYLLSAAVVAASTALLIAARRRLPAVLAVWAASAIVLSPVLGLFQTGEQIAAERYTYLPAVGLATLVATLLRLAASSTRGTRLLVATVAPLVLVGLALGTWKQAAVWRSSETLWAQTLRVYPQSPTANNNMGWAMLTEDRVERAIGYLEAALASDPLYPDALNNLGVALARQGRLDEAVIRWEAALQIDPRHASSRSNLDNARRRSH